jgi:hypothetical protein
MPTIATTGAAAAQAYGSGNANYFSLINNWNGATLIDIFGPINVTSNKSVQTSLQRSLTSILEFNGVGRFLSGKAIGTNGAYILNGLLKDSAGDFWQVASNGGTIYLVKALTSTSTSALTYTFSGAGYVIFVSSLQCRISAAKGSTDIVYIPFTYNDGLGGGNSCCLGILAVDLFGTIISSTKVFNGFSSDEGAYGAFISENCTSSLGIVLTWGGYHYQSYPNGPYVFRRTTILPMSASWVLTRLDSGYDNGYSGPPQLIFISIKFTHVDSSGNIYVAFTYGDYYTDTMYLSMYNSSGVEQWTRRHTATTGGIFPYGTYANIKTDASGNVYLAFITASWNSLYSVSTSELQIIKYNSAGTVQFAREVSGPMAYCCCCYGTELAPYVIQDMQVSTNDPNNLYITAQTTQAQLTADVSNNFALLIKVPISGNLTQTITFNGGRPPMYYTTSSLSISSASGFLTKTTSGYTTPSVSISVGTYNYASVVNTPVTPNVKKL